MFLAVEPFLCPFPGNRSLRLSLRRRGKALYSGMRITVHDVLSYLAAGMTSDEILDDFPYLTQVTTFKPA